MKAYISIKYRADNSNKDCIDNISSALERNGFETVCIARDVEKWGEIQLGPHELMQRTFTEIDSSNLLVVDLTEKGVGLGIEAGYAYGKARACQRRYRELRGNSFCMMNSRNLPTSLKIQFPWAFSTSLGGIDSWSAGSTI